MFSFHHKAVLYSKKVISQRHSHLGIQSTKAKLALSRDNCLADDIIYKSKKEIGPECICVCAFNEGDTNQIHVRV